MKYAIAVVALVALQGCSFLNRPGVAEYTAQPVVINGEVVCCAVEVYNTKDIGTVHIEMEKVDGDYAISVYEENVDASTPAQAQAEANAASANAVKAAADLLMQLKP